MDVAAVTAAARSGVNVRSAMAAATTRVAVLCHSSDAERRNSREIAARGRSEQHFFALFCFVAL